MVVVVGLANTPPPLSYTPSPLSPGPCVTSFLLCLACSPLLLSPWPASSVALSRSYHTLLAAVHQLWLYPVPITHCWLRCISCYNGCRNQGHGLQTVYESDSDQATDINRWAGQSWPTGANRI